MEITLDIETIPTNRTDVIAMLAANIEAPGQYKKADSKAQWLAENFESEKETLIRKTALDGAFGQVCCIGFAIDDEPAQTFHTGDERSILSDFASFLNSLNCDKYTTLFIGHRIAGFDIRFLLQRYIVNQIPVPSLVRYAANAKPWESEKLYDTMIQWAGVGNRISLEKLSMALNVESPKGEITGSNVYDHWLEGNIEGIAEYCKRDVEATRQVFKRMK